MCCTHSTAVVIWISDILSPLFLVTEKMCLTKQESASFHAEATPDETHLQGETFTNTSPKPAANTSKSSENQIFPKRPAKTNVMDISAPETNTRSKGGTKWREYSLGQVASPRLDIRDDHRGVLVNRCLPEETLDPLSTFMMLRAEQTVPVEPVQKTVNTPAFGRFYKYYLIFSFETIIR